MLYSLSGSRFVLHITGIHMFPFPENDEKRKEPLRSLYLNDKKSRKFPFEIKQINAQRSYTLSFIEMCHVNDYENSQPEFWNNTNCLFNSTRRHKSYSYPETHMYIRVYISILLLLEGNLSHYIMRRKTHYYVFQFYSSRWRFVDIYRTQLKVLSYEMTVLFLSHWYITNCCKCITYWW